MKESLIRIKQIPTDPLPLDEPPPSSELTETIEVSLPEESEALDLMTRPAPIGLTGTNSGGWKASDILREIRLDSFEVGRID